MSSAVVIVVVIFGSAAELNSIQYRFQPSFKSGIALGELGKQDVRPSLKCNWAGSILAP